MARAKAVRKLMAVVDTHRDATYIEVDTRSDGWPETQVDKCSECGRTGEPFIRHLAREIRKAGFRLVR